MQNPRLASVLLTTAALAAGLLLALAGLATARAGLADMMAPSIATILTTPPDVLAKAGLTASPGPTPFTAERASLAATRGALLLSPRNHERPAALDAAIRLNADELAQSPLGPHAFLRLAQLEFAQNQGSPHYDELLAASLETGPYATDIAYPRLGMAFVTWDALSATTRALVYTELRGALARPVDFGRTVQFCLRLQAADRLREAVADDPALASHVATMIALLDHSH